MKQVRIGLIGVTGRGWLAREWQQDPEGRAVVAAGMDVDADAQASFKEECVEYHHMPGPSDIMGLCLCREEVDGKDSDRDSHGSGMRHSRYLRAVPLHPRATAPITPSSGRKKGSKTWTTNPR